MRLLTRSSLIISSVRWDFRCLLVKSGPRVGSCSHLCPSQLSRRDFDQVAKKLIAASLTVLVLRPWVLGQSWVTSISEESNNFFSIYILQFPPLWSSGKSSWLQNGDVLCFLWGTNWIYMYYVEESRPPLWSSGQSSWLLNGNVLCFLWGTNWIYIYYVEESRPPLWSSGQSSWLQIQRSVFYSRLYQIFWEVIGLEPGSV
jgi:hypothetical protein